MPAQPSSRLGWRLSTILLGEAPTYPHGGRNIAYRRPPNRRWASARTVCSSICATSAVASTADTSTLRTADAAPSFPYWRWMSLPYCFRAANTSGRSFIFRGATFFSLSSRLTLYYLSTLDNLRFRAGAHKTRKGGNHLPAHDLPSTMPPPRTTQLEVLIEKAPASKVGAVSFVHFHKRSGSLAMLAAIRLRLPTMGLVVAVLLNVVWIVFLGYAALV
jgi:hypothetical protein